MLGELCGQARDGGRVLRDRLLLFASGALVNGLEGRLRVDELLIERLVGRRDLLESRPELLQLRLVPERLLGLGLSFPSGISCNLDYSSVIAHQWCIRYKTGTPKQNVSDIPGRAHRPSKPTDARRSRQSTAQNATTMVAPSVPANVTLESLAGDVDSGR